MTGYTANSIQYLEPLPPVDGTVPETPAEPAVLSRDSQTTDRVEMVLTGKAAAAGGVDHGSPISVEGHSSVMEYAGSARHGPDEFRDHLARL
jgi:hypothetical protein